MLIERSTWFFGMAFGSQSGVIFQGGKSLTKTFLLLKFTLCILFPLCLELVLLGVICLLAVKENISNLSLKPQYMYRSISSSEQLPIIIRLHAKSIY